jgi:hypothetical protein
VIVWCRVVGEEVGSLVVLSSSSKSWTGDP